MIKQEVFVTKGNYQELDDYFERKSVKRIFLVCDDSFAFLKIKSYFKKIELEKQIDIVYFSEFKPNPVYESIVEGVNRFNDNNCDSLVAVGGGSALDVAKCIKLFFNMNPQTNYLNQEIVENSVPFLAIPTTAGTGSEATRYAVIYYKGEKQSVTHESCIPSAVLMDPTLLKTLPEYQKKVTMLDALCHSIESYWSINSTKESKKFAEEAIKLILDNMELYLKNDSVAFENMLTASNLAGKAINITQTTAGHAMSYKLTSILGISHGHAVAICVLHLLPYMLKNIDKCIDPRGEHYLKDMFLSLARIFSCETEDDLCEKYRHIIKTMAFEKLNPENIDYEYLQKSINLTRMKNNPIQLDRETITVLYRQIIEGA